MSPDPHATITRIPGPVETTVGSEIVLMSLESGECYGLGETGSDVWRLLTEPIQFEAVTERLRAVYQAPPGILEQDVAELLEDMRRRNLIRIESGS